MKHLFLADLANSSETEIKNHLVTKYEPSDVNIEKLKGMRVIVAYESVGSWGCDSASYFLLRSCGQYFEVRGSHCSCYGFEGQFEPEAATLDYLKSDKFYFCTGGYDNAADANLETVKQFLKTLRK